MGPKRARTGQATPAQTTDAVFPFCNEDSFLWATPHQAFGKLARELGMAIGILERTMLLQKGQLRFVTELTAMHTLIAKYPSAQ